MIGEKYSGLFSIKPITTKRLRVTALTFFLVVFTYLMPGAALLSAETPNDSRTRTEQMLASILKSAPTGIGLVENRLLVEVNDYILELTGYHREELIGQSARMLYPSQEEFDYVGREKYRQIGENGTGSVETRWRQKDGSIRDVFLSSTPLDPNDLSAGVTFTVLDITERKQAEERFAKAFASNPGPLVISEIDSGRFIDVNDSWVKMLGYTREEQLMRTSKEVGIWSDPGERDRVIAKLKRQGFFRSEPISFKTKDGDDRYAHWSGEVITLGGREVLLSLLTDETERRQAEERFVKAFEANPGALIISEADNGRIIDANNRALEMFGYSKEEMVGKTTLQLGIWQNEEERERRVRKFAEQGHLRDEPTQLQARGGRELFVRWSAETIDLGGRQAILSFVLDETAFRKTATTLAQRTRWFIIGLVVFTLVLMALVARQVASLRELEAKTKELRAGENRFQSFMNETPVYAYIKDQTLSFTYKNQRVRELLTAAGSTEPGDSTRSLFDAATADLVEEADRRIISGQIDRIELEYRTTVGGESRWLHDVKFFLELPDGQPGVGGLTFDVTDRKKTELRNRLLSSILKKSQDFIGVATSGMHASYVNPAGQAMVGLDGDEQVRATAIEDLFFPEDLEFVRGTIIPAVLTEGRWAGEFRFRHFTTGEPIHVHYDLFLTEDPDTGEVVNFSTISRDISDRKKAEEALRASEENLRVTFASIGDAVIATDTNGFVQRMNPVAEKLTGWPEDEAVGRLLREVFRIVNGWTGDDVDSPVERVIATGEIVGLANHTVLLSRDGTRYQIADSGAPIRTGDNAIIGVVLVFRDVTGEYALQERLRHSQKMDAIGQLAGGVAHDFNNMLSGIMGGTELLKMRLPQDPAISKYLGMIEDSVQRAADLTEKLLSFARRQPVAEVPINIHRTIAAAADILGNTIDRRIRIEFDLETASPLVLGDATMLQNVFLNLGINASHAMPDGGLLLFRSRMIDLGETDCVAAGTGLTPGRFLEIEIRDTGCGVPAENLQRIFEPFFTTKPQGMGTGLGLAAALGTIQQHRGTITVSSELGVGTIFRILLPLTGQQAEPVPPPVLATVPGSGMILLVDDEAVIRDGCSAILMQTGYQVLTAEDGAAAVTIYRERHSEIDLVILDMMMPNMNGRDCFYALRAIRPDVRVILSSGYSKDNALGDMQANGLAGFIQKPFQAAALTRMIAAVMAGSEQNSGKQTGLP